MSSQPMQLVVVSAVMAAVSIATSTSTALRLISVQAFSLILSNIFMVVVFLKRGERKEERGMILVGT